jgi:hypothetical protein
MAEHMAAQAAAARKAQSSEDRVAQLEHAHHLELYAPPPPPPPPPPDLAGRLISCRQF